MRVQGRRLGPRRHRRTGLRSRVQSIHGQVHQPSPLQVRTQHRLPRRRCHSRAARHRAATRRAPVWVCHMITIPQSPGNRKRSMGCAAPVCSWYFSAIALENPERTVRKGAHLPPLTARPRTRVTGIFTFRRASFTHPSPVPHRQQPPCLARRPFYRPSKRTPQWIDFYAGLSVACRGRRGGPFRPSPGGWTYPASESLQRHAPPVCGTGDGRKLRHK